MLELGFETTFTECDGNMDPFILVQDMPKKNIRRACEVDGELDV